MLSHIDIQNLEIYPFIKKVSEPAATNQNIKLKIKGGALKINCDKLAIRNNADSNGNRKMS